MGKTSRGDIMITAQAVDGDLWARFKGVLDLTELAESKLAKYLLLRGLDAFERDGKLGPYVFSQPRGIKHGGKTPG